MAKETSFDFPSSGYVGLLAYDSADNKWYAVLVDNAGHLQLDVLSSALPTGAATSANQLPDGHNVTVDNASLSVTSGDDKLEGFSAITGEAISDTNLSAGYNSVAGTAVGTGKVWKITHFAARYVGTVPTEIRVIATGLAGNMTLLHQLSPVSAFFYTWDGEVYLEEGDKLTIIVNGATAGDDLELKYAGIEMDAP